METEKIIQFQVIDSTIFCLTNRGTIYMSSMPGKWEKVFIPEEVDKTLKSKKDETARKNKGK